MVKNATILSGMDLKAIRDGMAGEEAKEGYVYIHDGARPFVDEEIIKRGYTCVEENRACVAGMPSKDTVKIVDENQFAVTTPVRKYVWIIPDPAGIRNSTYYTGV